MHLVRPHFTDIKHHRDTGGKDRARKPAPDSRDAAVGSGAL